MENSLYGWTALPVSDLLREQLLIRLVQPEIGAKRN